MIKNPQTCLEIRPLTANDIIEVLQIETLCGLGEQSYADFKKELSNPDARLFVAVRGGEVLGFICARLITPVIELLNIGVLPIAGRQGIGAILLQKIMQLALETKLTEVWLEVRESNQGAQNFYSKHGFKIVGRRLNYYSNPKEDAILMTLTFSDDYPKK